MKCVRCGDTGWWDDASRPRLSRCPECDLGMMADRGLVDVEIVKKGDGSYEDGVTRSADDVKIRTKRGDAVWVSEKDVIARKPNPEEK